MDSVASLHRLLEDAEDVLVVGHASPDGDCISAVLALGFMLDHLGKRRVLVLPDRIPESLDFLPGSAAVLVAPPSLPPADLAIIPDCSDLERLGLLYESNRAFFDTIRIVNVDHHVSNRLFGDVNLIDAKAAAVCEQLFFLLPALDVPIDVRLATCLLTGIVTDSQTFRTPNTTARTLRVATSLVEAGAPLPQIVDQVYNSRALTTLRLWGLALSSLKERDGVIWARLDEGMLRESGASWEDSEALMNLLTSVRAARAVLLFKEMPEGIVKISMRSCGRLNVASIAAEFGGGGHPGAAGCSLSLPFAEAEQALVSRVDEVLALI